MLTGCNNATLDDAQVDDYEPRVKVIPTEIYNLINEDYILNDTELLFTYWFSNAIVYMEYTSNDICTTLFEGDLVTTCEDDLYNMFPSDFGDLEISRITLVESTTLLQYEITSVYENQTSTYIFSIVVNNETNKVQGLRTSNTYNQLGKSDEYGDSRIIDFRFDWTIACRFGCVW